MVGVGKEPEYAVAFRAPEFMTQHVGGPLTGKQVLQGAGRIHQHKCALIHDLDELACEVAIFLRIVHDETFRESVAFRALSHSQV